MKARNLWPLAVVAATAAAYGPAYGAGYIWDDDAHVTRPDLTSLHGLHRIWFDLGATQQYYPVLHSAFWLEHRLWGDHALGYHLLNVLLHAAAAIVAGLVLRRLGVRGAEWAAAAFALHPVNVETVAWISEQKNTLSALFYGLAALGFLRWHDRPGRGSRWAYGLATLAFLAALLSKSVAATLPAALLVALGWRDRRRPTWRKEAGPLLPWLALGLASGLFTAWVERTYVGAGGQLFAFSWADRLLIAGRATCFYAGKLVWPADLSFIYPRWNVSAGSIGQGMFPLAVLLALALLVVRHRWGVLAASLCFVGTLFPALGFVNVYPFVFSFVADHFQYLAELGLLALAASAVERIGVGAAMSVLIALAALTWRQCTIYRTSEVLYRATLRENPRAWLAHDNLGVVLAASGRTDEAMEHYRETIRLRPDYPEAYNNLGNALAREGRFAEAQAQYAAALKARPGFALAEYDWGNALSDSGNFPAAERHYADALRLHPDYPEAEYKWGNALANGGQVDAAIAHYQAALRLRPGYPEAEANLGLARAMGGQNTDAIRLLESAVRQEPKEAEFHAYLGFAYSRAGRLEEAAKEYRTSLSLHPNNPDVQYQLREVERALGRP